MPETYIYNKEEKEPIKPTLKEASQESRQAANQLSDGSLDATTKSIK